MCRLVHLPQTVIHFDIRLKSKSSRYQWYSNVGYARRRRFILLQANQHTIHLPTVLWYLCSELVVQRNTKRLRWRALCFAIVQLHRFHSCAAHTLCTMHVVICARLRTQRSAMRTFLPQIDFGKLLDQSAHFVHTEIRVLVSRTKTLTHDADHELITRFPCGLMSSNVSLRSDCDSLLRDSWHFAVRHWFVKTLYLYALSCTD